MKPEGKYRQITDALVWGGVLISVGIVLLLNSLGILSWDLWEFLWRFWPLFLIVAGLNIVFGSTKAGSILVGMVSIALLLAAIFYSVFASGGAMGVNPNNWNILNPQTNQPTETATSFNVAASEYENVKERDLNMEISSAKFSLADNEEEYFLDVQSKQSQGASEPKLQKNMKSDLLELEFSSDKRLFGNDNSEYNLVLGRPELPTSIFLDLGSGSGSIDLNDLSGGNFVVEIGSGTANITLGEKSIPSESNSFKVSSGTMSLNLPADLGLKITYRVNSGSLKVGEDEIDGKGVYTTDDYSQADHKMTITLEVNSGSVSILQSGSTVNES